MAYESGGFAIYQVSPLLLMYRSPDNFVEALGLSETISTPQRESEIGKNAAAAVVKKKSNANLLATEPLMHGQIKQRVVLIEMQFTTIIIALVMQAVLPSTSSTTTGSDDHSVHEEESNNILDEGATSYDSD